MSGRVIPPALSFFSQDCFGNLLSFEVLYELYSYSTSVKNVMVILVGIALNL